MCQINPWDRVAVILSRIKPPNIPTNKICDITSYGAVSSAYGTVDLPSAAVDVNAKAFRDAIDDCSSAGGGTVNVPDGIFITSAITLQSNVALNVSKNAIVRFTRDTSKYPLVFTRWEGMELMNYSPLIYAFEAENIAITGINVDCVSSIKYKYLL